MTSTNDGKEVKNSQIIGQKAKTYFIELYKTLEARLSVESELGARTSLLCEAWRRVHCLCQHSATSTHPHLINWLQRHTAQTILQSEWRHLSVNQDKHDALGAAIDFFILECQEAIITRQGPNPQWETQLLQLAEWFKTVIPDPWGNAVLKALLDPRGEAPSDRQIVEWLKEERGVFFVTRLRQLASSKKTVDIALSLAAAVMERARAGPTPTPTPAPDSERSTNEDHTSTTTFMEVLTAEADFTLDVWNLITDIEFVLLYSDRSKCIALAKQTPLKNGYELVERLHCRLDASSHEKRLWKNAKDVAILIAQVMVARCMVVPVCAGAARTTLYGCSRSLVKLLPAERLPAAMAALAAPAATARHLHMLAEAVHAQCENERKPFVCELYIRAITAGMNELEKLKLSKEKETEARTAERLLGSWFTSLGSLLGASVRLAYECALTAFSLHPSFTMYEHIRTAPQLQPAPVHADLHESAAETNSEFGSWATDSRSQTNFVKTSETLNLKKIQQHSNVLSTAVLNEGEALGLSPELCQDLIVLLSGPRVKTLSWDMDKDILIENCRSYMERTHGGTRAVTTELKYLNLEPNSFMHLPEEEDEDEGDIYYGIEKGYEHLVELQEPEEIWEDALSDLERTESCYSTENEMLYPIPKGNKKGKSRRHSFSTEDEELDPLSDTVPKTKHRSYSSESRKPKKERSKERSKERKKKDGQSRDSSNGVGKSKTKKDEYTITTSEYGSIAVDVDKLLQKPKRERKKREKRAKGDLQKLTPTPTALSRLIGKKVIKTNMLNTHEHTRNVKREMETELNNQIFITDSDYDSQGKSSITSMHTDGNDPDVLFDGLFSMDDIKSPEKTTEAVSDITYPAQVDNMLKRKYFGDNTIKTDPNIKIPYSSYVQNDAKDKVLPRSISVTPSLARNANETLQLPCRISPNAPQNVTPDEVKLNIKRLIEFRRQKSVTDLSKMNFELEMDHQTVLNKTNNVTLNKNFGSQFGMQNRMENESGILPGSLKAISVPDIPKVFINKKQSQQINHLKSEVETYLLNCGKSMGQQTLPVNNGMKPEVRFNEEQLGPKPVTADKLATYTGANKFQQNHFNLFYQSESNKVTSTVPNTSISNEAISNNKHNLAGNNVSMPDQNKLQDFFRELHRSNNAGVSKNNRKRSVLNMNKDSLHSPIPTNYSAKPNKPLKKVENAPNTFARLKYMHKNKQGDNVVKQNSDHLNANKFHKSLSSESVKEKNDTIDTLLSRVDCTVIRKVEKTPQRRSNSSTGFSNVSQNVTKKPVSTGDRVVPKSNSLHSPHLMTTPTAVQPTRAAIPRPTMLANCKDDQLKQLLRQNSKCHPAVTRPQIRSEVILNKGVSNVQLPTASSSSQNLCQQIGGEIYNRLQGCPIKIQPCQNVPGQIQNISAATQPKSISITKTKDISTKSNIRHKSAITNTKVIKDNAKSAIVPQNWESVLNDLLSHKTPPRNVNSRTQLTKDKQIPYDQGINKLESSNNMNCNRNVVSEKQDRNLTPGMVSKSNKPAIHQHLNMPRQTNIAQVVNNTPRLNGPAIYAGDNASPLIVNQPLNSKPIEQRSVKKPNQPTIIKRIGKTSEEKLPLKKDLTDNVLQIHTAPVTSNVPSSEYDILGELMDDDLRQEIGELSSDEESFSTSNVIPKGKTKGLSNKLMNIVTCPDSSYKLNNGHNQSTSDKQVIPILQSDTTVTQPQIRLTASEFNTTNIKSKTTHTEYISNDEKCQNPIQKATTGNIIHHTKTVMPSYIEQHRGQQFIDNKIGTINPSLLIDNVTSNNCIPSEHSVQKSVINCSSRNIVNDNSRLTSVNQKCGNVFHSVPQQQPTVKNVVLIRPEIIYDPYTVQVHQIPKTVNSSTSNLNTNKYVAVNTVPTISMFGAQFSSPVVSPVIIGKTISVPITKNSTSLLVNTCVNNKDAYSDTQLCTKNDTRNIEVDKKLSSLDSSHLSNEIKSSGIYENITKSETQPIDEETIGIDNIVNHIPKAYVKVGDSISKKYPEGTVSAEIRERHIVNLPCTKKLTNTKEVVVAGSAESRHRNLLNSNKNQNTLQDSTAQLLLVNKQPEDVYLETDKKVNNCMINKQCKITVFSKVQEKHNIDTCFSFKNNHPEKTPARCGNQSDCFEFGKFQNVPENTMPHIINPYCTTANNEFANYPKTDIKVSDTLLQESENTLMSKNQDKLNIIKSPRIQSAVNNIVKEKSSADGGYSSSLNDGKNIGVSKTLDTCPVSKHCSLVKDLQASYVTVKEMIKSKTNERIILSKDKQNLTSTTPCYTPNSITKLDYEKSVQYREHSIDPKKCQNATTNGNSYLSSGPRPTMVDVINCKPKADGKLNENLTNKTCERKVLSEVQEKHTVLIPEKIILKTSIGTDDEIKKDILKTREERIKRKKTAILNRQVHIFSDVKPIPLSYAPLNTLNVVTYNRQKNAITEVSDSFICSTKLQPLTSFNDTTIENDHNFTKDLILGKTDDNANSFCSGLKDGSKENNDRNITEFNGVKLQSSYREEDNLPSVQQSDKLDVTNIKTKVKVKKIKDRANVNKLKVTKKLKKKDAHKRKRNKRENIASLAKGINNQNIVTPILSENIDIQEQLQRSVESKQDLHLIKNTTQTCVPTSNKDNVQTDGTARKKIDSNSSHDQNYKNKLSVKETLTKSVLPDQNCTAEEPINNSKLEYAPSNYCEVVSSSLKPEVTCDEIKFKAQTSDELITLNDDILDVISNKETLINKTQILQDEHHVSVTNQQVSKNFTTCENGTTVSNLSRHGKTCQEKFAHDKFIDSYKDKIVIQELPRNKDDDPLKRRISLKLANGNSFKATVSGKLQIDINSLFEDPAIRSVLMNNIPNKSRCILNIHQVISSSGDNIRTRVVHPKEKYQSLETINLVSDDEDDSVVQVFNTEFGKYKVRNLNDYIFRKHQNRFSQRCSVKVQKIEKSDKLFKNLEKKNDVNDAFTTRRHVSDPISTDMRDLSLGNDSDTGKNFQIIEIDDSSNESINTNKKTIDTGLHTHSISTPDDIEVSIKELKETLLKDLCIDMNNKRTNDNNIPRLDKLVKNPMNLENSKESVLKDLCHDLKDIEKARLTDGAKIIETDGSSSIDVCRNTLPKNSSDFSTNCEIISSEESQKSACQDYSTVKNDQRFKSTSSESVLTVKSKQYDERKFSIFNNKLLSSKRCQLKIEKCDELAKKYQLLRSKRCFVSLERCDRFINSEIKRKCEKDISESAIIESNEHKHELKNSGLPLTTELETSKCSLKRSGSFSILNEINLYDQSLKFLKPNDCAIDAKIVYNTCETQKGESGKRHEKCNICESDWFMTKSQFNSMMKLIPLYTIISDDASTDCDSDRDDNCSYLSDTIVDVTEKTGLTVERITYKVPSLIHVALKFFTPTHENFKQNNETLDTNCSIHHLKRKLSISENTLNDRKHMKVISEIKCTSSNELLNIKNNKNPLHNLTKSCDHTMEKNSLKSLNTVSTNIITDNLLYKNDKYKSDMNCNGQSDINIIKEIKSTEITTKSSSEREGIVIDNINTSCEFNKHCENVMPCSNPELCNNMLNLQLPQDSKPGNKIIEKMFKTDAEKRNKHLDVKVSQQASKNSTESNEKSTISGTIIKIDPCKQNSLNNPVDVRRVDIKCKSAKNITITDTSGFCNLQAEVNNSNEDDLLIMKNNLGTNCYTKPISQSGSSKICNEMSIVEVQNTHNTNQYKTSVIQNKLECNGNINDYTLLSNQPITKSDTELLDQSSFIEHHSSNCTKNIDINTILKHGEKIKSLNPTNRDCYERKIIISSINKVDLDSQTNTGEYYTRNNTCQGGIATKSKNEILTQTAVVEHHEETFESGPQSLVSRRDNEEMKIKNCHETNHLEQSNISVITCTKNTKGISNSLENGCIIANNFGKDQSLLDHSKNVSVDEHITNNDTSCPKNITLLYQSDSKVILKGSIIKDPIVGTCYVFPIVKSEMQLPVVNDKCKNKNPDKIKVSDVYSNLFQETDLIVTKPKVTYSKTGANLNYSSENSFTYDKLPNRNLKRKIEFIDSKIIHKKYRKGKNIDHPKTTVAAVRDFGYSKEFQNLSNYCDSIKFSYTKQYHLIQLDDVHTMLKNWPIKEPTSCTLNGSDADCKLFIDVEEKAVSSDPTEQTLAEEILAIYEEKDESTSPVIKETNFSMGFGEGSGRVDQNLVNGEESTKISAVTLSDVKQCQPFLQSLDNGKSYLDNIHDSREKQMRILDKCYSYIKLRDQVQSFFRKTTAELNYSWLKHNFKSEESKFMSNDLLDPMSKFPFDLNVSDFFEPPLVENIVQVVQVGQLPVNNVAQNPITCDPRVTQVSDASPPQCSIENVALDDSEPPIKSEYTELTTADISLPLVSDYDQHHQGLILASQNSNLPACNDNITIETEVKIEVLEEGPDNMDEQGRYESKDFSTFSNDQINNTQYSINVNGVKETIKTEESDVKIVFEPAETNVDMNHITETYEFEQHRQSVPQEKPDQLAHAMNAAGITTTPEPVSDTAIDLSNSLSRSACSDTDGNNYPKSNITAMALQHALAQILPSTLNQPSESESNPQVSVASQILHIVHGKNNSLNQITLPDNSQQSVISTATPTPVLHIVQSKNGPLSSSSNGSPVHNSNSYNGLSLVDAGLSHGGNQLLHIVNAGNQKSNNGALLKRVNLLTNLTNVQGSNEQKMVQFVCKSADPKGIQLNNNQRSMVLRLHTIESSQTVPSKPECQEQCSKESATKEPIIQQELKSRSVYEENYAKFIQNSSKQPVIEKSTSLPKFNQAFGKPVFQEENQKSNDIETSDAHLPSEHNNIEGNECQTTDNQLHLDNIRQIASPPLLLRKASTHTAAQQNLVQQIKQAITPMNIQTMHGGVIYTRQIPVNIGGGQTINLITVPSTERIDESGQKQKTDVKFGGRSEIEPSIIKIVPQNPATSSSEISANDTNNSEGVSSENAQNSQPTPMLTQMRIKLPMLSKNPQMVSAARVVRPSFFQIQRNVIGGPNQPVYQQLVLTAAPTLGQQAIRLPHAQTSREIKVTTENQASPESQMSSSTLEQLREFDMVLEQVKERSTVQPNGTPAHDYSNTNIPPTDTTESVTRSSSSEVTQQVLYSIGNNQSVNVAYVNRKSTVVSTPATTSFARSPDSSGIVESPTSSSHSSTSHASHTATSETTNGTQPPQNHHKSTKINSKSKSRPKSHHPQFKINSLPPKPSNQKPMEDEQTTQRILYILAEYKEQVENSPDKDKPAPRRRTNLQASVTPPGGSKRKKSSSGSRRSGRDSSPLDDNCRTMGSEDSSCGTSQGDCNENCQELHSPQGSPRKVAKKLSFEQDSPVSQSRALPQQPQPQLPQSHILKQTQPTLQRNVLVTDGPTIAVTRATPGKPATAVLMPANYILPVSMVKSGQQIAIVTNRGPKILTVGGGEGGATNALLLQRLINPTGLKPVLARPGVRHVRLPTAALHNLQAFNLAAAASSHQPLEAAKSPVPATTPPQNIESTTPRSPWTSQDSEEPKPEQDSSPVRPEQERQPEPEPEPEAEPEPEPDPEPDQEPEPWNVPHDYSYEETVRTEMDRTVLDAIPDRYSPDMEAQRIFDKMFDVESKKGYIDSQDDSPRCPYDIDASDCDDKAYHQVVQRRDGVTNRHRFISAATLRQKFALMEDELRLQKSLSEECEDLGVDSPSASDLFPEAELLFSSSPAHEVAQQSHTPQPVILNQSSGIPKPDLEDQAATDQLITRENGRSARQTDDIDLGLDDVGIVTVSEDGMRATISLDHEEFVRSHPNTTFHSELTEEGEVQPVTLADLKARHITSTIFHAGRAPATVLVTAPQTTVISQATPDGAGVTHVRCSHADGIAHDGGSRYDVLGEPREPPNTASAIIHSTGNATQVIRRVCYERTARYFLDDDLMSESKTDDGRDAPHDPVDDDRSSPERHSELFWDHPQPRESRRVDFGSDSDKCCKSPYEETNSTDSTVGVNMRLDSVIKDARGIDRSGSDSVVEEHTLPPLRTYPPKRTYHSDGHRSASGKTKTQEGRSPDGSEGKRRASNRGVVKRGCHCCNGTPAPPKPKKPRQRKPTLDFN